MRLGAMTLVVFCLLAGAAAADHDSKAAFAGNWTLDPNGRPGKLSLRLVDEADGRAAFERRIVVTGPDCGARSRQWYIGTFTTPNDGGPVVGCTTASGDFSGFFKSTNFGGKVGKLNIPEPRRGAGTFTAHATQPGDYSAPYAYSDVPIRFAGHFGGDGAGAGRYGRFAFRVDAPANSLFDQVARPIREYLFVDRIVGSGSLSERDSDPGWPATGKVSFLRNHRIGTDRHLTLAIVGNANVGRGQVNGVPKMSVKIKVEVTRSDDPSCRIGRRGEMSLIRQPYGRPTKYQSNSDVVMLDLCRYDAGYSAGIWVDQIPNAVKIAWSGEIFDQIARMPG